MSESSSFGAAALLPSASVPPGGSPGTRPGDAVRHETCRRYAYLCRRAARRFLRAGLERTDLEQVAAIGLLKAVDRFEAERGTPFEAYAWLSIVSELLHHVRDHEHLVRLPRRLGGALPRFRRSADGLMQRLEREATDGEIASDLARPIGEVRALRTALGTTGRLSGETSQRELERAATLDSGAWAERLDLDLALSQLPARERRVVLGAYVLGLSNVELGDRLDLSARHVSRLRRQALAKMHQACALGVSA